jgi:uncharacterized protein (TIGR00369 family)
LSDHRKEAGRAAMPASRAELSGLDYFRRIQSGEAPRAAMLELLGMRLLEVDEGRVVFGVTPSEQHYNAMGIAHGGLAATLLDSALGCAINTLAPAGKVFTTLELKVNFTRPIRVEDGPLRCEARVVHMGSRTATSEGRIVDARGQLYAHGTTTCIVVDA